MAPSTPAQNAKALDAFFKQAGIGDPKEDTHMQSTDNFVVLVFGDLFTGEHIRSLMESRSEEKTRGGGFSLSSMSWDCFISRWLVLMQFGESSSIQRRHTKTSKHMGQIRPKETGKIDTNPGFGPMHEVIQHVGIVSRLDCWVNEARKQGFQTLEDFAASNPSWEDLQKISYQLAVEHLAGPDMSALRVETEQLHDELHENMLLRQQYFLLYEQMSFALNMGDIGRVETLFLPWMYIFQGCGKHKYAAEMKQYLENVHFIYPKGLR